MIKERIEELQEQFSYIDDWEEKYKYIMDIGKSIAPLADYEKNDETKVRGCSSQVWLISEFDKANNKAIFRGESDSALVQGLVGIMITIYSDSEPSDILENPPQDAFEALELFDALTPNRANGLRSIAKRIVDFAASCSN